MKKFLIKVNGNQYEVEVEEIRDAGAPAANQADVSAQPADVSTASAFQASAARKQQVEPSATKKAPAEGAAGNIRITAPMPGTILKVAVKEGDVVSKGQVLLILEAMKMENEIVAPSEGTVASINVARGASVNAGDLLISMN